MADQYKLDDVAKSEFTKCTIPHQSCDFSSSSSFVPSFSAISFGGAYSMNSSGGEFSFAAVSTSQPVSVINIVCSNCADR